MSARNALDEKVIVEWLVEQYIRLTIFNPILNRAFRNRLCRPSPMALKKRLCSGLDRHSRLLRHQHR